MRWLLQHFGSSLYLFPKRDPGSIKLAVGSQFLSRQPILVGGALASIGADGKVTHLKQRTGGHNPEKLR
jgi:hypothetical protein